MEETRAATILDHLYDAHGTVLIGYLVGQLGGDRGKAEDIAQETLLRAWRHAGQLDLERGLARGWLFRVARNLVIDARRAQSARPTEVGATGLATEGVDTTEEMVTAMAVRAAVRELSRDQRAVIVHLYLRGFTAVETARALGIPLGTVKSRAHHALRKLRRVLEDRGADTASRLATAGV
ncbi:RNA polymerase sigma-70 factor (ECF subfamily) [Hamadaea flava]|uniref:Sigma-70 family RNA polymerase sigma factor n=1 Tax=Hamadaea flava TaxID=1742688 RepID=A0ABV8LKG3_9ACTN|nr:sigma-70 family RNA polymerase sigma factor [Hamadaea flava]MCP2323698.1 RNA polymerase sigma-70 factor (ECF subfamily) [Hamadaea flava]